MPDETNRKLRLKRIKGRTNPEFNYIDVPVIDKIQFKDRKTNSQETVFRFNNTQEADRKVHVKKIYNETVSGGINIEGIYIEVERIETLSHKDRKSNSQEVGMRFKNDDPPPRKSDGTGPGHLKTHVVRYTKDNTPTGKPWVDIELIDKIEFKDPKTNAQATIYRLTNPEIGAPVDDSDDPYQPTFQLRDESLERYPDGGNVDPPFRLDPFQNIVNINGDEPTLAGFQITWFYNFQTSAEVEGGAPCTPQTAEPGDSAVIASATASYSFQLALGSPVFFSGNAFITTSNTTVSGEPTPPMDVSEDDTVSFEANPHAIVINEVAESADIPMKRSKLTGAEACYNDGSDLDGKFGRLITSEEFSVPIYASGISATLLGKVYDTKSTTFLNTLGSTIAVRVGFVWRIPVGFDLSSGDPLP